MNINSKNLAQILRIEKGFQEINLETLIIVAPANIRNLNQIINDLEAFYNLSVYLSDNYGINVFVTSADYFQKAKTNKSI